MQFAHSLTWRAGLVVFLVALVVGLGINAVKGERSARDLVGDESEYHHLALRLAESGQFGTPERLAYRAPGYPALLAAAFHLHEPSVLVGRLVQSILAAGLVLLTFVLATSLAGKAAGRLAALMIMIESYWWLNQWSLLQENLLAVLLAGVALCALRAQSATRRNSQILLSALGGFLFGLSLLTKPIMVPLLGLAGVLPLFSPADRRRCTLRNSGAFVLVALLTLLPWTVRNWSSFGQPVALTTGSGRVFSGSHCPETFSSPRSWGTWFATVESFSEADSAVLADLPPQERELRSDRLRWSLGFQEIRRHSVPKLILVVTFKWLRTCSPSTYFGTDNTRELAAKMALVLLNMLILVGFASYVLARRPGWWVGALLAIALLVTTTIFWGCIRFRYPLQPVIAGFSAVWWGSFWRNLRSENP